MTEYDTISGTFNPQTASLFTQPHPFLQGIFISLGRNSPFVGERGIEWRGYLSLKMVNCLKCVLSIY